MGDVRILLPDDRRFSQGAVQKLQSIAEGYVKNYDMVECKQMVRDKMPEYYDDIFANHGGIMKPYYKDNGGDPRNPINRNIKGVFFNATVSQTGAAPMISKYGTVRYSTKPYGLLRKCPNIYFADFYCVKQTHHVQLVMTTRGSSADVFCSRRISRLQADDNPFFRAENLRSPETVQFWVPSGKGLKLELLFTENVHLQSPSCLEPVRMCYDRFAGGKGVLKKPDCTICNLPDQLMV